MTYKKDIYDYANKIDLETVESCLTYFFMNIANEATRNVWEMNIEDTIQSIRDSLNYIEDCLNGTSEEKAFIDFGGKEYSNQALELRNQIIDLRKKYYDYVNDREDKNE